MPGHQHGSSIKDPEQYEARTIGIEGRSKMTKGELIDALRNH
jgi:hypothetical protein